MNFVKAILVLESGQTFSKTTGDTPVALVDILGKSVLQRTVESLTKAGLGEVSVVAEGSLAAIRNVREKAGTAQVVTAAASQLWRTAEQRFEQATDDATHILMIRLNAYVELNWEGLLEHHRAHGNRLTRVVYDAGPAPHPVDVYLASASRRNDTAFLLRSGMRQSRTDCLPYVIKAGEEYAIPLQHEADLRRLASDALHRNCKMQPVGTEIRPGVWVGRDAQIDKRSRLVAPIFVGSRARVCPGAVITRGSSIERHAVIGNKTVVENATILPYTNLGPGLDVSHSVVGERHIFHIQRNICTPIQDPKLLNQVPAHAGLRAASSMAKSLTRIPKQIWQDLQGNASVPEAESTVSYKEVFDSAKTQPVEMPEVSPGLAVMRRYGNQ